MAAGVELGFSGMTGIAEAGEAKKKWASIFAGSPESESLDKMLKPYPDLYMKIRKSEIA